MISLTDLLEDLNQSNRNVRDFPTLDKLPLSFPLASAGAEPEIGLC
jgi:hypothetical protein